MSSRIKRIVSIMMCLLLLVGAMSSTAFAAKKPKTKKIFDAYAKVINKYVPDDDSYCDTYYTFYNLTGDKTEELIITHGPSEGGKVHDIYTYKKGKAKKVGKFEAWHSALGYKKKGQLLQYQWNWSGATINRIQIKKGKVKRKEVFRYSEESDKKTTLEKKMKKKGYNKIKWLKDSQADDLSLLDKHFPSGYWWFE